MVRMLMVNEARPISRSDRRSCSTSPPSQCRLNGASVVTTLRAARSSTASPAHIRVNRNSSTAREAVPAGAEGLAMKTTFCSGLAPVSRPALPSLNSNTTGDAVLEAQQMAPAQSNGARPDAGILRPQRQCRRRRSGLVGRAREFVGIKLDAMMARGLNHCLQRRMQRHVACRHDAFVGQRALVARHYGPGFNPASIVHGRSFQQAM